eukprot:5629915-Pyramimonas_sp.AAC.1
MRKYGESCYLCVPGPLHQSRVDPLRSGVPGAVVGPQGPGRSSFKRGTFPQWTGSTCRNLRRGDLGHE